MKLKNLYLRHKCEDIYVIGSGPSLQYIEPDFFCNKVVVCTNNTINFVKEAKAIYMVAKEPSQQLQDVAKDHKATIVMCEYHSAGHKNKNEIMYPDSTAIFRPNPDSIHHKRQTTALIISASTISTAMHLAAFMGTKAIMLIGHDCGKLDEKVHLDGYQKENAVTPTAWYGEWMKTNCIEYFTMKLKYILRSKWGVKVYSVNPFINFGLEGHSYSSFSY